MKNLVLALFSLLMAAPALAQPSAQPNVVLILTDDMGWADIGSYGAPDIKTPHIDSLARDGVKFTDFYANGMLCSPTRAGLITGRYQQRYGLESALTGHSDNPGGLAVSGHSLPQLLKNHGYTTALVGKWHLGLEPEFSPNAHGFDEFFGVKGGYCDYYTHHGSHGDVDLWHNDKPGNVPGYMTDLITEQSVSFIKQNAKHPFFIDVAYNAPHWPFQPPGLASAPGGAQNVPPHGPGTGTRADYAAMVERVDRGVGKILRTLEQAGLAKNTLVIFSNDNGGEWLSNSAPLFNRKSTVWEGGIRVPALIRWPARLKPGKVTSQVGITMDLTASILAATGTQVPLDARLEGMNLFPILEGQGPEVARTLFWRTKGGTQKAVRDGDFKLVIDGDNTLVYDVRKDMGERNDLTYQRQDVAVKLKSKLEAWEADVDAEARASQAASAAPR
jgi:arylsulfatase A-like enzyme